jgi:hypothetical protein
MFFDNLIEQAGKLDRGDAILRNSLGQISKDSFNTIEQKVAFLDATKPFLLDAKQAEVFLNTPHRDQDYRQTFKMPFPSFFVEFSNPLRFESVNWDSREHHRIRGLLIFDNYHTTTRFKTISLKVNRLINIKDDINLFAAANNMSLEERALFDNTLVAAFYNHYDYDILGFNTNHMPSIAFPGCVEYDKCETRHLPFDTNSYFSRACWSSPHREEACEKAKDMVKIEDLVVNLINFLNARNTIEIRQSQGSAKLNKKRAKKGKKPLTDYYTIAIEKKQIVYEGGTMPHKSGSHSFCYDVIGHPAFYNHCPECSEIHARDKFPELPVSCKKCDYTITGWDVETRWISPHQRGLANEVYKPKTRIIDK